MADGMIHILHDYWLGMYKEGVGKDTVEDWADPNMEVCCTVSRILLLFSPPCCPCTLCPPPVG